MKLTLSVIKADEVRHNVKRKAVDMRRQGLPGAAMLPMGELEYTGVTGNLAILDKAFKIRPPVARADAA